MLLSPLALKVRSQLQRIEKLKDEVVRLNNRNREYLKIIENRERVLDRIVKERTDAFPWIVRVIADYKYYLDMAIADYNITKKRPAIKAADRLKEVSKELREVKREYKRSQYLIDYYNRLFPWLMDYVGINPDYIVDLGDAASKENEDPVKEFMTLDEYKRLPSVQRNQMALDRYLSGRKKPWQIGRDYEGYVGYMYEIEGYEVDYFGMQEGFDDLGRDLICRKGDLVEIVQCKFWAQHKTIHENHINQLFGTAFHFFVEKMMSSNETCDSSTLSEFIGNKNFVVKFITSTTLSERAKSFAKLLNIKVVESLPMKEYPMIKCNISKDGERIYHLPFDQQYNRTKVRNSGEFYASTVAEAERLGYRRAYRWKGGDF